MSLCDWKRITVTGCRPASLNLMTFSIPRWNCSNSTAQLLVLRDGRDDHELLGLEPRPDDFAGAEGPRQERQRGKQPKADVRHAQGGRQRGDVVPPQAFTSTRPPLAAAA